MLEVNKWRIKGWYSQAMLTTQHTLPISPNSTISKCLAANPLMAPFYPLLGASSCWRRERSRKTVGRWCPPGNPETNKSAHGSGELVHIKRRRSCWSCSCRPQDDQMRNLSYEEWSSYRVARHFHLPCCLCGLLDGQPRRYDESLVYSDGEKLFVGCRLGRCGYQGVLN